MNIKLYGCIACFLMVFHLGAQEVQIKTKQDQTMLRVEVSGGLSMNSVRQNLSNLIHSRYIGKEGYFVNASVAYRFEDPLIITAGISLLQKDFEFKRSGPYEGVFTDYNTTYLNFPIMLGAYLINPYKEKGWKLSVAAGGYLGHWLDLKRKGRYQSFAGLEFDDVLKEEVFPWATVEERYDFDTNENQLNRFDYGVQGEVKVIYDFSKYLGCSLGYTYKHGLSNIYKTNINDHPIYNRTSVISIGMSYKL